MTARARTLLARFFQRLDFFGRKGFTFNVEIASDADPGAPVVSMTAEASHDPYDLTAALIVYALRELGMNRTRMVSGVVSPAQLLDPEAALDYLKVSTEFARVGSRGANRFANQDEMRGNQRTSV